MDKLLEYMDLAYPYDLTIATSKEHGEVDIKLYDLRKGKVIDRCITLYQIQFSEVDLIVENIKLIKDKLNS